MDSCEGYKLTIDLNVLNHLGINLYSNIPAVISEVVANAWDADAEFVEITIDKTAKTIEIKDDGFGMSHDECNAKFLNVGYRKRDDMKVTPHWHRHVMGRKGIGKLSLFSIAGKIEVHTVKKAARGAKAERSGFLLVAKDIEKAIKSGSKDYLPKSVDAKVRLSKGTSIVLRDLKKSVINLETFLRKRLARRFGVIGPEHHFEIRVNNRAIGVSDRDYWRKIEYLWTIGDDGRKFKDNCDCEKHEHMAGIIDAKKKYRISGWIGTFDEQKSIDEGNNSVVVMAWEKLIHEDILKDIKEGGLFTKYLIGEIHADFLDDDNKEDIATSDRQSVIESDPRFIALKKFVQRDILKEIQSKWRHWRNEDAEKKALENEKIKAWFNELSTDNKRFARQLFGKIESFPIENPEFKRELYRHGILAFETLALEGNLSALDKIDDQRELELLTSVMRELDSLEAFHYYQVAKNRVGVLHKFERIAPSAREKVIQQHIFDHLWLLDPSWERASTDARMEQTILTQFGKITAALTPEEKRARLDIGYKTAAGKHIIVELKRYNVKIDIQELIGQIRKYRSALIKCLESKFRLKNPAVEVICILGAPPSPTQEDRENREQLKAVDARYITYDELIQQTRDSYRDYIDAQKKIDRIEKIVASL